MAEWITPIVRMEILYSVRSSAEYVALEGELDAFPSPDSAEIYPVRL